MFVEKYTRSVNSSDLRDDELHHATDALVAAALADASGSGAVLGSLLARVKYADGTVHKSFEAGTANLASLVRAWTLIVTEKGRSRGWMKPTTEWDVLAALSLYKRVAEQSLAYWLDGHCEVCHGAKVTRDRRTCTCCGGTGRAAIEGGRFETDKIKDMVSELEGLFQAHSGRAAAMLRRAA
jgi:DnaJ-class molecular chaperone